MARGVRHGELRRVPPPRQEIEIGVEPDTPRARSRQSRREVSSLAPGNATRATRCFDERVGPFWIEDGVPREIRRQQWSVFNVPLMWFVSEGDQECAVLNWVSTIADRLPPVQTFLVDDRTGGRSGRVACTPRSNVIVGHLFQGGVV